MAKMKSLLGAAGLAAVATLATQTAASAEERKFEWSFNVGGVSDYIFRGVSLSGEKPVFQAGADVSYGIWYAGIWGTDLSDGGPGIEVDFYTGIKPVWGPVTFDFGVLGYTYTDSFFQDYVELKAGASMELMKNLSGTATIYWQPEQAGGVIADVWTVEGTLAYALPQMGIFAPSVSGTLGYADSDQMIFNLGADDSYVYWNAGLALAVDKLTLDFRYWDTDMDYDEADSRFVFSAKVTLP
jgi:uncharacterized protein (TIGR02001 family)